MYGTSQNHIISFIDYQNSKHDIISIAYIVINYRISVFPFSSDYNRIRGQQVWSKILLRF